MSSAKQSDGSVQDYVKMFLISLVTSVAVLFGLGPVMLDLNERSGPRPQAEAAAPMASEPAPAEAEPEQMTAPNLQGLAVDDALERWRDEGIQIIEESQRVDPSVEPGTILSQNPAGGAPLEIKEIRVVVSALPEMVTVPSVVGKTIEDATNVLNKAGFEVPAAEQVPSTETLGTVLSQEPDGGEEGAEGSLVRLVVAGPESGGTEGDEGLVEVPKLTGIQVGAARRRIEKAGLEVGQIRQREDPEIRGNTVVHQEPARGTMVEPGTAVELTKIVPDD